MTFMIDLVSLWRDVKADTPVCTVTGTTKNMILNAMMDGAQLRWLRVPGRDLNEMWASCEDVLFPLPQWEGYR